LGFVRHIAAKGGIVFAAVRSPPTATALQELQASSPKDRIHIIQLDVTDTQSLQAAVETTQCILQGRGLDYLINNAGKIPNSTISELADAPSMLDPEVMLGVFKTNVVGPAMVFKTCIPLLERSKRKGGPVMVNIGSGSGSICKRQPLPPGLFITSYSVSKAALNMLTVKQAKEKPNMIIFALNPGWVKTDMGGENAAISISESVSGQYAVIVAATCEDTGTYKRYTGETIPW